MKKALIQLCVVAAILSQLPGAQPGQLPDSSVSTYIVLLKEPSVAEMLLQDAAAEGARRPRSLAGPRAQQLKSLCEKEQQQVVSRLSGRFRDTLEVLHGETLVLNSLVVRGSASTAAQLAASGMVKGVYPNRTRRLLMDAAPNHVQAPALWQAVGGMNQAGTGIRIGLIDSGVNHEHVMFEDETLLPPEGFPISEPDGFANSKVIVARTFVSTEFGLRFQADNTPRDEIGHGSQVAGAAAGVVSQSNLATLSGIAPKAFLGNYKVFGTPGINSTTTSAAIIAAINAAVADGMDVINLSLGGGAVHPARDPEQMTIANASALGIVFAIAAGNAGPGAGSLTSPGTSPEAITVGATSHSRIFGTVLETSSEDPDYPEGLAEILYQVGSDPPIPSTLGPFPLGSISGLDDSQEACSDLGIGTLTGQMALVKRGGCTFLTKARNVLSRAGAEGMVVYNDEPGLPIEMTFGNCFGFEGQPWFCGEDRPERPAVMIPLQQGELLSQLIGSQESSPFGAFSVDIVIRPDDEIFAQPGFPDQMARFSGRGPAIDLGIKPDLVAPGQSIHTASNGPGFTPAANGTSFATPMVAGAAAILRQIHPQWSSRQIKSVLVNSASAVVTDGGSPAGVNSTGASRLDLHRTVSARAWVDPVNLSFGNIPSSAASVRSLQLTNITTTSQTFQLTAQVRVGAEEVEATVFPPVLVLDAMESAEVSLVIEPLEPDFEDEFEGLLRIQHDDDTSTLAVAFWGRLFRDLTEQLLVSQAGGPGVFESIQLALNAAEPGDTILITDSVTYNGAINLELTESGTRLDHLTIRGEQGQRPVIDGGQGSFAVRLWNVSGIRLENLTIRGSTRGLFLENADASVVDCLIETSSPAAEDRAAVQAERSGIHLYDTTLSSGSGVGLALYESDGLVQHCRIGDTSAGSASHGILASQDSRLAIFDSRIVGSGGVLTGQGIRSSESLILVKGTRIETSHGGFGDGIQATNLTSLLVMDSLLEGNEGSGISSFNGSDVSLLGSVVRDSGEAAVTLIGASGSVFTSSLINNSVGAVSENGGLRLRETVISGSLEEGVKTTNGQLHVVNTTVTQNQGAGVRVVGTPAQIFNSILFGNIAGDLQDDLSSAELTSNLVGDLSKAGVGGNFGGDPGFVNVGTGDYALSSDSDAIDRGTHEVELSSSDRNFHQRVVDGGGDPEAVVDVGAFEFASDRGEALILPILDTSPQRFVGLALANARVSAADPPRPNLVSFRVRRPDGSIADTFELEIQTETQTAFLLSENIADVQDGWLEIRPSDKDLMSFALTGDVEGMSLDGSQLSTALDTRLVFPEILQGSQQSTRLFLVNPNDVAVQVQLSWHRANGVVSQLGSQPIAAGGSFSSTAADLGVHESGGFLVAEAGLKISGLEIFGSPDTMGGLLALQWQDATDTLYGAQLASGAGVETNITVINLRPDTQTVDLVIHSEQGEEVESRQLQLAPLAKMQGDVRQLFDLEQPFIEGWLEVRAPGGGIVGSTTFREVSGRSLASLPLQTVGAREFVLSQVAETEDIFTGITLLNATATAAFVSVEVFTSQGEKRGTALLRLRPGSKIAQLLSELFPELGHQERGFVRVRSDRRLFGYELFGRRDLEFLSAVPQQTVVE